CGGDGKSTSSGATKSGPAQKICVGAPSADVTLVLGASTKGIAKDVPGGHGCVWKNGSDAALAVMVYDASADLPTGDGAAKSLADSVGLDKGGFSSSSITTMASGKKPVALLLLSTGSRPADSAAERRISDAAVAAAG
ncbi:MAG: hypothetical protein M3P23_07605, partial [Actinomycetota bacterium]|nr:hypothetical protein [Actinomycetota bacterium]